jgi:DNA modification methylase
MKKPFLPIHPFPARMAPEVAVEEAKSLGRNALVLDPMAGSGTTLRIAAEHGCRGVGFDLDPLAVLIAKVSTTPIDPGKFREAGIGVVHAAHALRPKEVSLPWLDEDDETKAFVNYWFATTQQLELRKLSAVLSEMSGPIGDALRIAFSRLIITKDRGASLARDVSHSRPHKVMAQSDYPVLREFELSVERMYRRFCEQPPPGNVEVRNGDARHLVGVEDNSVEACITSPPYLNAIDYLRGHRLSLVWFGYQMNKLRAVRAASIGSERAADPNSDQAFATKLVSALGIGDQLPSRDRRILHRYALDIHAMMLEMHRVLRRDGRVVLVIGDSYVKGVFVQNSRLIENVAGELGFILLKRIERQLPEARRYLPPPQNRPADRLDKRMRSEIILTFSNC